MGLTVLTERPVQYSTFEYGDNDTQLGRSGLFGTIVKWDIEAKEDCYKANFVFLVKKAFDFLDLIGIGTFCFGISGFNGKIRQCQAYQTGLGRNREAREKIINALGGPDVCTRIPSIAFDAADLTGYLKLGEQSFRSGQWVVQGEDSAGRKFVAMRLSDSTGRTLIATAHQRYRETCIDSTGVYADGSFWTLNFNYDDAPSIPPDTARVAEFIENVRTNRHAQFSIAPKP